MKISFTVEGDKELQAALKKMFIGKIKKVQGETYDHGLKTQREAQGNLKRLKKWDTGNAADMIILEMENYGMTAVVKAEAPYSVYIEYGTRPFFPPYKGKDAEGLEDWAKRHGFDSIWPICLAIAERGLPETPFLGPAYSKYKDKYYAALRKVVMK